MIKLKDIKMKSKLITAFLLVGLIPLAIAGWWNGRLAANALMTKSYAQLEAVRGIKTAQIERYFNERRGDMGVLAETVAALRKDAFDKLQAVQKIKKSQLTDYFDSMKFQLHTLKGDPYIMNALTDFYQAFEAAGDSANTPEWNALAKTYDPRIRSIMKDTGWDDIFLIHTNGAIVYTVSKKSDLGMIIPESELREQGIGKAFHEARNMSSNEIAFADTIPYSPSGGSPVSFMMAQIRDKDRDLKGYIAFQVPLSKINQILLQREGMGKTGESYLVGQDFLMRSDSYLDKEGHSVAGSFKNNVKIETEAVNQALSGKEGQKVIIDYNGNPVLSSWDFINLGNNVRWAMISEIDVAEAYCPVDDSGNEFFARYQELYGYYDLFLINPDGYIFYSVKKEPDYKTNIIHGKYSNSNMSKLIRQVLNTKQFAIADFEPYAPSNNEPAAFIAQPLVNRGNIEVVVALQISIDSINTIMQERTGMGKSGETYLVGPDKLMRSDSFLDHLNHSVKASFANPSRGSVDTDAVNEALAGKTGSRIINDYNGSPVLSSFSPLNIEGITWVLIAEIDENEVKEPVRELVLSVLKIGFLAAALIIIFAFFIAKGIASPLVKGVEFAKLVAKGDLTAEIDVDQKDEVGMLSDALKEMIARIREIVQGVETGARNVTASAEQLSSVSQQMSAGSEEMSQGTSEQSSSTEQVSASMEQMAANIRQNADNALQTEKLAMQSAEDAQKGGIAVGETVAAMKQIAEKISIIEEIARQTDLLALNAAVEAARAGQHGKGFAVVASEVRKLAERSQLAAVEINKLSSISVSVAENAGEMLKKIVPDIKKTAELVREISAACNEQDTGAAQINEAILQLDSVAQQNASISGETAASAEEMSATAEEMTAQAEELQRAISFFKIERESGYSGFYSPRHDQDTRDQGFKRIKKDRVPEKQENPEKTSMSKEKNEQKPFKENKGYSIELSKKQAVKDKLDSEFEVY
ncbi:Methyl-accepting chemotaxis protein, double Cache and HAMP domains-containing [Desulfonema limicola]|uniref:Methyl-accepting chemotaxis protein, double Cache and HAMP domains-containing n=1 Tax=Desulfonema limicola TaxID=45656 RepID=A0A975B7A4_9BACT|nr:methyl-accepting chemotaxis protein [Desulfonema limicola]QTA79865.1 Methyl-accepting chemotaxis protein, double Cache and HAMP domains-containing [Desulfonema limicola]